MTTSSEQSQTIIDGRFVLEELLSQGGVGTVWKAKQLYEERYVALKLLRPEMSSLPQLRRRFAREARAASRLDHPNIATVYEYGVDESGKMFMAMELIHGARMEDCILRGLSLYNILLAADQLLAGLAHAHARGVIHRDLKPGNILFADAALPYYLGVAKIVDFGIATIVSERNDANYNNDTEHGEVVGTPRYMSPEQASGERNLSPRTDLYNIGLLLYELITGSPPFGAQKGLAVMSLHVHEHIPPMIPRHGLSIPTEVETVIMKAVEKKPSHRWASAAEMRAALQPLLQAAHRNTDAHAVPNAMKSFDADSLGSQSTVQETVVLSAEAARQTAQMPATSITTGATPVAVGSSAASFQWVPFVGRPVEREKLIGLVHRMRETRRGTLVLIDGEAGVGKTRLTMWVKEQSEEKGLLEGHIGAFTRGGSGGLRAIQEVLEGMFGTRELSRGDVFLKVKSRLVQWGQDNLDDAHAMTDFLRPEGPEGTGVRATPLAPSALFAAICRVLALASHYRPRLVILDDVHWAGREFAEFLDYLAVEMRHRSMPMIVVGTIRTEDLAENPAVKIKLDSLSRYIGETVERITLERFKRDSGHKLVHALLPVDNELADIVFTRSGGNPLHLVLLLRYLRDEGLLQWDESAWRAKNIDEIRAVVPPSLVDLFRVRIHQVEERYGTGRRLTQLMHRAAVAGAQFSYDLLREIITLENHPERLGFFDEDFERLLSEGFIVESHGRRDDWYGFSHALVRDYFLSNIGSIQLNKRLHQYAAEALVTLAGGREDNVAMDVAMHWQAARHTEYALQWYRRAAKASKRSFTLRQALNAYERLVELFENTLTQNGAPIDELGPAIRARRFFDQAGVSLIEFLESLAHLGDLFEGFGDYEDAENAYRKVVRTIGKADDSLDSRVLYPLCQSWLGLGHVAWQRGDFSAAEWAFHKVRQLVNLRPEYLVVMDEEATRGLARVAWHRGEYQAAKNAARQALESAINRGDEQARAESRWILGEIARVLGNSELALSYFTISHDLYYTNNIPTGIARNLLSMAQVARHQKNFHDAESLYERALKHYESLGDRRCMGQCYNGLGDIARFEHRFEQATKHYDNALSIYLAIGAEYDSSIVYANLGLTAIGYMDFDAAKQYLERASEILAGQEYPYVMAGIEYNLALVEAMRGDDVASGEILEKVFEMSERFPIPDLDYAQPLEQLARLRHQAGKDDEAMWLWKKALDIYRGLELSDDVRRVEQHLAKL